MVKYITIATTCNIYDEITYLKQEFAINGLVVFGLGSELRQKLSEIDIFHCGIVKLLSVELLVARHINRTYITVGNEFLLAS